MVSSLARSHTPYDVYLAYGGETQGFMLAKGEDGHPLYRPALAPDLSPQQNTDVFSYEHRDSRIDLPAAFEDFSYGAGFEDVPDSAILGSRGYHYSQGVDLSWGKRAYLSPLLQTGGSTTQAPKKFAWTSLGLFAMTARYVFEWTGSAWTQRLDTGGAVTNTDLIEFRNSNGSYLLLGVTGSPYYISVDGLVWTQPSSTGSAPAHRASSSNSATPATSITVAEPAGAAEDDIIIAVGAVDAAETITPPTGWTEIVQQNGLTGTTRFGAWWVRRGATAPGLVFSWSSSVDARFSVSAYSGAAPSGLPFDPFTSGAWTANASGTSHNTGTGTALGSNRTALALFAASDDASGGPGGWTAPAGYTERVDNAASPGTSIHDDTTVTAGAVSAAVGVSASAAASLGVLLLLKPNTTGARDVSRFAARGSANGTPVLWALDSEGDIRSAEDPTLNTSWSAADATQMGEVSITIGGLEVIDNVFYLVHSGGITSYNGTTVSTVWSSLTAVLTAADARPFTWVDNLLYFTFSGTLLRFDPETNGISKVWPRGPQVGSSELNGTITAITGDEYHLYFALENGAGNTYIMKGDPQASVEVDGHSFYPFHTWSYRSTGDCDALLVVPAGTSALSSTNPTLVFGDDLTADYFILPKPGRRPEDDSAYRFVTEADRTVYWPFVPFRAQSFEKWLTRGDIEGDDCSATSTIALLYQKRSSEAAVNIATATTNGRTTAAFATELLFTTIRPVGVLNNGGTASASPTLKGVVLHAAPNPPRDRMFTLAVKIEREISNNTGEAGQYEGRDQDDFVWSAVNSRVALTDPWGTSHTIKVLDVTPLDFDFDDEGSPAEVLSITGVKI